MYTLPAKNMRLETNAKKLNFAIWKNNSINYSDVFIELSFYSLLIYIN